MDRLLLAEADTGEAQMPSNEALQTGKGKLSCFLHTQEPRQLAVPLSLVVTRHDRSSVVYLR